MISPKATLALRPAENQLYYFTYASGFRPGNVNNSMEFNRRSFSQAGFPQSEIDKVAALIHYEGDQLDSFELGAKIGFAHGRAQLIASAYYQDWKDMISLFRDRTIPGIVQGYHDNTGAAESKGLKVEFNWEVVDGLRLRLAADINDSELGEGPDLISFTEGNSMRFAPEWSVAASVDYTIELPGALDGRVRVDHQRVGEQYQPEFTNGLDNLRYINDLRCRKPAYGTTNAVKPDFSSLRRSSYASRQPTTRCRGRSGSPAAWAPPASPCARAKCARRHA